MSNDAQETANEFKAWRERQTFKTLEIAHRAELVQFDLEALAELEAVGHEVKGYKELAQKNIAQLVELLKSQTMGK